MTVRVGTTAILDFPGHALHGKRVRVEAVEIFDLAPEDGDPYLAETIFVSHPSLPQRFGTGRERLQGTAENMQLRKFESGTGDNQGELF